MHEAADNRAAGVREGQRDRAAAREDPPRVSIGAAAKKVQRLF